MLFAVLWQLSFETFEICHEVIDSLLLSLSGIFVLLANGVLPVHWVSNAV